MVEGFSLENLHVALLVHNPDAVPGFLEAVDDEGVEAQVDFHIEDEHHVVGRDAKTVDVGLLLNLYAGDLRAGLVPCNRPVEGVDVYLGFGHEAGQHRGLVEDLDPRVRARSLQWVRGAHVADVHGRNPAGAGRAELGLLVVAPGLDAKAVKRVHVHPHHRRRVGEEQHLAPHQDCVHPVVVVRSSEITDWVEQGAARPLRLRVLKEKATWRLTLRLCFHRITVHSCVQPCGGVADLAVTQLNAVHLAKAVENTLVTVLANVELRRAADEEGAVRVSRQIWSVVAGARHRGAPVGHQQLAALICLAAACGSQGAQEQAELGDGHAAD
mmetsp:Transcript_88931/g.252069  ORF Transcript_88931/g.252069 Transcript_88931/m.252069 type:complete len:327 (-) Transcript_88931:51-1031(-)